MIDELKTLLESHAAGIKDRAGVSHLDIWMAERRLDGHLVTGQIAGELVNFVGSTDMNSRGLWATIEYLVRKLAINSPQLAGAIDQKIASPAKTTKMRAFDIYCAWKAVVELGGSFYPKILKDRLPTLRAKAAPHWLDLAILAYGGDQQGLSQEVIDLADEKLISNFDLEDRYQDISAAIGATAASAMLREVATKVQTHSFVEGLVDWADTELGLQLANRPLIVESAQLLIPANDPINLGIAKSQLFRQPIFEPAMRAYA